MSEQADGIQTKIESQDIILLENNFPSIGEIDKNFHFFEMEDFDISGALVQQAKANEGYERSSLCTQYKNLQGLF